MNFATIATIVGFVGSLISLAVWLYILIQKVRSQIEIARQDAAEGTKYAEELVSSATSAEKRADIYLFVTLRALQFSNRRMMSAVSNGFSSLFASILVLSFFGMSKFLQIDYAHPMMFLVYFSVPLILGAWTMALWYGLKLRKIEDGWQLGVTKAMQARLSRHGARK